MSTLWKVSTNKFINEKESIMRTGNVYQIANGYMGYRGTLDEFGPDELVGITLAGVFDRVGDAWGSRSTPLMVALPRLLLTARQFPPVQQRLKVTNRV